MGMVLQANAIRKMGVTRNRPARLVKSLLLTRAIRLVFDRQALLEFANELSRIAHWFIRIALVQTSARDGEVFVDLLPAQLLPPLSSGATNAKIILLAVDGR